jgi:hypothetical protein
VDQRQLLPAYQPVILASVLDRSVMQYGTPSSRLCARAKPNTEPSQSSASNLIGAEKRHSVRVSCAGPRAGGGRRTGHVRRAPVEDRSRMAGEGLPRLPAFGFPTLSRSGARLQPLLYTGQPGAKRRKQVLSDPRSAKRTSRLPPSISTPFAQQPGTTPASRHPSAAATRPYGTAALRGPAATDPDTPAR